ncbi:MAG TPA: glycosyltransferase family 9 protein, partial [Tepidisphaeraceae bacterium]|nr:glycosyltransferase family 9 protein [Tepidisphaeraceae bacterium]
WPATYVELLKELRQARVFVGNDSGPAHLAGIIGVPTVALFGASDSRLWKPLGPHVAVVERPLGELSMDQVLDAMNSING